MSKECSSDLHECAPWQSAREMYVNRVESKAMRSPHDLMELAVLPSPVLIRLSGWIVNPRLQLTAPCLDGLSFPSPSGEPSSPLPKSILKAASSRRLSLMPRALLNSGSPEHFVHSAGDGDLHLVMTCLLCPGIIGAISQSLSESWLYRRHVASMFRFSWRLMQKSQVSHRRFHSKHSSSLAYLYFSFPWSQWHKITYGPKYSMEKCMYVCICIYKYLWLSVNMSSMIKSFTTLPHTT